MRTPSHLACFRRLTLTFGIACGVASALGSTSGCAASSERPSFETTPTDPNDGDPAPPETNGGFDRDASTPTPSDPVEVHEVYGHSSTVLYKLDPKTKDVTKVGAFTDCDPVWDIALDENSNLYAVAREALYTVDKVTAACKQVATGNDLPNSLSFVPKGTVDANAEALVGYDDADYVRIDPVAGTKTKIGSLQAGKLVSSGDIVAVKGGKAYLTVKPGVAQKDCQKDAECAKCITNDCLVEVDPASGKMLKNWGSIEHKGVFGLSFWGGNLYGFDTDGDLFEVTFGTSQVIATDIPMPSKPSDLSFWGAGSSTSAPLVTPPQ